MRTCTSRGAGVTHHLDDLAAVVPRTIESSISTTRWPSMISRTGLSLIRTPKWRIDCLGSMKVRPT